MDKCLQAHLQSQQSSGEWISQGPEQESPLFFKGVCTEIWKGKTIFNFPDITEHGHYKGRGSLEELMINDFKTQKPDSYS